LVSVLHRGARAQEIFRFIAVCKRGEGDAFSVESNAVAASDIGLSWLSRN